MKLEQEDFKPITITLESAQEAQTFWDVINESSGNAAPVANVNMRMKISGWFSNCAHL
jgi:hypothetical protein